MWADKIDDSAISFSGNLDTSSIDRSSVFLVAILAIWSAPRGRIALLATKGESGRRFPVGTDELPLLHVPDRQRIADFLDPIIDRLHIPLRQIARLSGLPSRGMAAPPFLAGGKPDGAVKSIGLLPYRLELDGWPQIPGGSWHSPTDAEQQLASLPNQLDRSVGTIVLSRALSSQGVLA